jgi:hypothetical protein
MQWPASARGVGYVGEVPAKPLRRSTCIEDEPAPALRCGGRRVGEASVGAQRRSTRTVVRGGACVEDERVSTLGHGGGRVPASGAQTGSPLGRWRRRCGHGWVGGGDVGTVRQCVGECRSGGMISQGGGLARIAKD